MVGCYSNGGGDVLCELSSWFTEFLEVRDHISTHSVASNNSVCVESFLKVAKKKSVKLI